MDQLWDKGWYILQYSNRPPKFLGQLSVCAEDISVDKKPHDCDWETAPLGGKNCHYEEQTAETIIALSTDRRRIVSYDGGKSWFWAAPGDRPHVSISWVRIDD